MEHVRWWGRGKLGGSLGALSPGTRTHLEPGHWGCGRSRLGWLCCGHLPGLLARWGRCAAPSGSCAPQCRWQPGHGDQRWRRLLPTTHFLTHCLLPSPGVLWVGSSLALTVPGSAVPSTFLLALPARLCKGRINRRVDQLGKKPRSSCHQKEPKCLSPSLSLGSQMR